MSRKVPPLNPLRVFECVARQGSFTKAAVELFVSQSAVSRQIATLEDYLGIKLFIRDQGGVCLTEAGESYQKEIGPAFTAIASATERLQRSSLTSPLRIQVYTTFAAKWLIKRLNRFKEIHPEIPIRISTSVAPINFSKSDADAAIQLCGEKSHEGEGEHLFDDIIEPVCSPDLIKEDIPITNPIDILEYPLLQSHYRKTDFKDWLNYMGVGLPEDLETTEFPSSLLAYQGAIDNMGIAMGQTRMLQDEFRSGTLVRPFNSPLTRELAYYLIYPEGRIISPKMRIFREWLLNEIKEDVL
ncbi:LysR substrate-binding domain-containing protein [Marinobacter sp.]|uniref:LysR substrate-binding domain-containing protein n=1 Tax=Marinobacter sp. TaxID=50741 RepID=UPI0034A306F0